MITILIVDDEQDFSSFLKQNLELSGGYSVIVANDGKDGITAAARHKPDLILLDVIMPHMSGFEVLRALKNEAATADIPVVMLTAVDPEEVREKAIGLHRDDYLIKPVGIADLRAKVNEVLSRRGRP